MQTGLPNIGNSCGIIIPASLTEQLQLDGDVEVVLAQGRLIIKPIKTVREGWRSVST